MMRAMLYGAAQVMLTRTNKWSWLKAWAMQIARRRGMKKAIVALARLALSGTSPLWILDEPFNALDKAAVSRLRSLLAAHVLGGGMIVLTTHLDIAIDGVEPQHINLDRPWELS